MPCTIIVKLADAPTPDSPKKWYRGDIVQVVEVRDPSTFSPAEQAGFYFVDVSDMTRQAAKDYYCVGNGVDKRVRYWDVDSYVGPALGGSPVLTFAQVAPMVER
jgi:hypothetical protein